MQQKSGCREQEVVNRLVRQRLATVTKRQQSDDESDSFRFLHQSHTDTMRWHAQTEGDGESGSNRAASVRQLAEEARDALHCMLVSQLTSRSIVLTALAPLYAHACK